MKTMLTFFAIGFLSFQILAQDTTSSNNSGNDDIYQKMINAIKKCKDVDCLAGFYNRMAGVCTGETFRNDQEKAKNIMVFIFKEMDKHMPGVLFEVYMKSEKKYQNFFIDAAKKLPLSLREEMARKAKTYQDLNNNTSTITNVSNTIIKTNTTTNTADKLVDIINKKIEACNDGKCLANIFNVLAKTTMNLKNKEQGIKIMGSVLKLINIRKPGMLFDVYLNCDAKYRDHFISAAKLLPKDAIKELLRKMKAYRDANQ